MHSKVKRKLNKLAKLVSSYRTDFNYFTFDYLGIELDTFQYKDEISDHMSFVCRSILYPSTLIIIAEDSLGKTATIIDKIMTFLYPYSPSLQNEIKEHKEGCDEISIQFKNGSSIVAVKANGEVRRGNLSKYVISGER